MTSIAARAVAAPVRLTSRRARLLLGCALAGVAAITARPPMAAAQSADHGGAFEGFITSATPDVHRNITSSTTETIMLGQSKATINWSPYDNSGSGNIDFLPQGHVVIFTNEADVSDFTVLNRIVPSNAGRAIELNGKVVGQIRSQAGTVTGGHIWFYSPGGIIVGSTAMFDVGGLLLTTNDPGASWDADATGFSGSFNAASGSKAKIIINPGAQINATPQNSYIALIAPRIEQRGTLRVNGSAALVAGERLTMTMDQGLFDIEVDIGTSDAKGIIHTGTTGGPASAAADDYHRIYLVAVPKNQALTMVLGGTIGFAPASSASVENGQIILSAGSNIADSAAGYIATQAGGASAEIDFGAGTYGSDVAAIASGDIDVRAGTGAIAFAGDVTLTSLGGIGDGNVTLGAIGGHALTIGGDLTMITQSADIASSAIIAASNGGTIDIAGAATLIAGAGEDGSVGSAEIRATGGSVSVGGLASLSANGDPSGGSVVLAAADGGTIDLNGGAALSATGVGNGGSIGITADGGGAVAVSGDLTADASGASGGTIAVSVGANSSASLGTATLAALSAPGSGNIAVDLGGDGALLSADGLTLRSSGGINMTSSGGGIAVADTFSATAGGLISFDDQAGGALLGAAHIILDGGAIASNWALDARTIALTADDDASVTGDLMADDAISLVAGGDIVAGDLLAGGSVVLDAKGSLTAGDIAAGSSVTVDAGGDFTLADVSAPSTIDLTAGGTANFLGVVSAPTITVTSADINIAAGAALGEAGVTDLLTLNAVSNGAAIVIGAGAGTFAAATAGGPQYRLDEVGGIFADKLVVNAIGTGADIELLNTAIDGDAINHVELNTDGSVFVEGKLSFANASATDSLAIDAGGSIIVNTTTGGSVIMSAGNGTPGGALELTADNVWVAEQALLDQLAADPNFVGRNAALKANNGAVNTAGYLQAGGMLLSVGKTLFLQNSGTATEFAGITVGGAGLTIQAHGAAPATVVAFGQQIDFNGSAITGDDFFKQIKFGGLFTDDSEVNGCGIGGGCIKPEIGGVESILGPVGLMGDPDTATDNDDDLLISTRRLTDDELIEDPVTSGSDSGQWGNDKDDDDDDDDDDQEK